MTSMFYYSASFNHILCGAAWVDSKATGKARMFQDSWGKIAASCPVTVTSTTAMATPTRFSPHFKVDLQEAVSACLALSPAGDCPKGAHGPIGEWDVSAVTEMSKMFYYAAAFNADISKWDVSSVTDMRWMFFHAHAFNADISQWDVSSVTDMRRMFFHANSFNVDISNWDVSSVTDMTSMFYYSSSFNHILCGVAWVHSRVIGKDQMFERSPGTIASTPCPNTLTTTPTTTVTIPRYSPQSKTELRRAVTACLTISPAGDCSQGAHGPIGEWDVSAITDMSAMFALARAFDADISKWDASAVTNMASMFSHTNAFNSDISKWDVSAVTDMRWMFSFTHAFNADISKWDVSSVTDVTSMFYYASSFNHVLCGTAWVHSKAIGKVQMFTRSSGTLALTSCTITVTTPATTVITVPFLPQSKRELEQAVTACLALSSAGDCSKGAHGPIGEWDVSGVTDMNGTFYYAEDFNADISKWDVSAVVNMRNMFSFAYSFNADISKWDVSSVMNMHNMFVARYLFNGDISKWDVSSVTDMRGMFSYASVFNADISKWKVSSVINMRAMFSGARTFNADISKWDVSSVADMTRMFYESTSFNHVLCGAAWVNSKAIGKDQMFVFTRGKIASTSCTKCPKCGTIKNSGSRSCCAPDGAWFNNCGSAGSANAKYTWVQGIQACRGE